MKLSWAVECAGTGMSVPDRIIRNDDFLQWFDTSDEWIVQRTGIRERRWTRDGESTLSLATAAGRDAIADAGISPDDIDLIVVATITPEHTLPSTACELQAALGCRWVPSYDLSAACSGFVYAMTNAAQSIELGMARTALVVGVDCMTRMNNLEDRASAILFGDGAAAAVLRRSESSDRRVLAARLGADGGRALTIYVPAGGAALPASQKTIDERLHFVRMQGREVYKFAVTQMHEIVRDTAADAGVAIDDIKLIIPHQSNLRIIESAVKRLNYPLE
ncbi:MAG: beta-ketoacyl-ACP synthase 3, partial [Planctomycetota bacterium]